MIVAGFAGVGKSTYAANNQNVIDFHIMSYKYSNLDKLKDRYDEESIKAAEELELNIDWRYYYYKDLVSLYTDQPDKIVLIPTDTMIMQWLEECRIPFICVYPAYELKDEYRERYIKRGNGEDFITIFIKGWLYWITMCQRQKGCIRIELKSGEYLSDVMKGVKL